MDRNKLSVQHALDCLANQCAVVYWALLYSAFDSAFSTWTNTSQHALNAGYALFEIVFPRTAPLPFFHLVPIIVILAMYLALAYITNETEGFYVYSFLDPKSNSPGALEIGRAHV